MSDEEILPCPFCGGKATVEEVPSFAPSALINNSVRFSVGCNDGDREILCMGYQSLTSFNTQAEAIAAWNKRAEIKKHE
jgi:Restriction alleviation protein Lar